jgi:hypothetical protein
MTIRLLPKTFAIVRAISFGRARCERVATTLNPEMEGYLDLSAEANAKGVTQVAPFVFVVLAKTCRIAMSSEFAAACGRRIGSQAATGVLNSAGEFIRRRGGEKIPCSSR